jgi:hypothetical protein
MALLRRGGAFGKLRLPQTGSWSFNKVALAAGEPALAAA